MSILSMCVVVSGKFSVKKSLSALREWVFPPSTGPQESKDRLQILEILGRTLSQFIIVTAHQKRGSPGD